MIPEQTGADLCARNGEGIPFAKRWATALGSPSFFQKNRVIAVSWGYVIFSFEHAISTTRRIPLRLARMNFGDYIDIDRQLHLDPLAEDPVRRLERDREIGRALEGSFADARDGALLLAWKKGVSREETASLGNLVEGAVWWTAVCLVFFGGITGVGAAGGLLRYDGTQPINVLFFLGAIVGIQLLLLPMLILGFLFRSRLRRGYRLARGVTGALFKQVFFLLGRTGVPPERLKALQADFSALAGGSSFYRRIQPLLVLLFSQIFGVAFNVAVAVTLLFFVLFSDLTFSWGTTLQVEPEEIHRLTSVLSFPWAGIVPEARPSLELVESTQFVRMDGEFVAGDSESLLKAGGWWSFLFAATIAYGLLPRVLALVGALVMLRCEMRRTLVRSSQAQALRERLRTPIVKVNAEVVEAPAPGPGLAGEATGAAELENGLELAAVYWAYDDAPPEEEVGRLLRERLGAIVVSQLSAGGIASDEEAVVAELKRAKEEKEVKGAAVFFEPFEPPKTDALRFLARIREALGSSAPIVIFLTEFVDGQRQPVEAQDWDAWNHAVRAMGDPLLLLSEREVTS